MFLFKSPSEAEVPLFLERQKELGFSYREICATHLEIPALLIAAGYTVDHSRIRLGSGERTWNAAVLALRNWQMFNLGWVRVYGQEPPISKGADVAVLINHSGFFSLNGSRIVYVIDDYGATRRFGFAYGTLANHAESGEERFSVEWRKEDDSVWYDLLAFSKPQAILAKFANPVARSLQKRFARDSGAAMLRAVAGSPEGLPD